MTIDWTEPCQWEKENILPQDTVNPWRSTPDEPTSSIAVSLKQLPLLVCAHHSTLGNWNALTFQSQILPHHLHVWHNHNTVRFFDITTNRKVTFFSLPARWAKADEQIVINKQINKMCGTFEGSKLFVACQVCKCHKSRFMGCFRGTLFDLDSLNHSRFPLHIPSLFLLPVMDYWNRKITSEKRAQQLNQNVRFVLTAVCGETGSRVSIICIRYGRVLHERLCHPLAIYPPIWMGLIFNCRPSTTDMEQI